MSNTEKVLEYITEKKDVTLTEVMAHCLLPYPETCAALDELVRSGKIVLQNRVHYRLKRTDDKRKSTSRSPFKYNFD